MGLGTSTVMWHGYPPWLKGLSFLWTLDLNARLAQGMLDARTFMEFPTDDTRIISNARMRSGLPQCPPPLAEHQIFRKPAISLSPFSDQWNQIWCEERGGLSNSTASQFLASQEPLFSNHAKRWLTGWLKYIWTKNILKALLLIYTQGKYHQGEWVFNSSSSYSWSN